MIFTDASAERAIRAFSKAGLKIVNRGKHIGVSDGIHHIRNSVKINYPDNGAYFCKL